MFQQFKERAVAVGAEVHRFATRGAALEFVLEFFDKEGVADAAGSYAVWAASPFLSGLEQPGLERPGLHFEVTRERAAQAKIGVSQLGYAVADTGSLVGDQEHPRERLVSSLPSIHLALVPSANLVPDKVALFRKLNPAHSRYIAFITGPSRTADIERVLTIGVHGPERLVIVFVDDLEGA